MKISYPHKNVLFMLSCKIKKNTHASKLLFSTKISEFCEYLCIGIQSWQEFHFELQLSLTNSVHRQIQVAPSLLGQKNSIDYIVNHWVMTEPAPSLASKGPLFWESLDTPVMLQNKFTKTTLQNKNKKYR